MELQTLGGTLLRRMVLMDAAFGDIFLNVGRVSFPSFTLKSVMELSYLFGIISGVGKAS